MKRFRGGLVVKAHRPVYHSTLGVRVIKKNKEYRLHPKSTCPSITHSWKNYQKLGRLLLVVDHNIRREDCLSHTHPPTLSPSLTHTPTHSLSLSLTLSLTHTHFLSLSLYLYLSLSHTHTHTHAGWTGGRSTPARSTLLLILTLQSLLQIPEP